MGSHRLSQAVLKLLDSGDPPALASQNARITGMSHHTWPKLGVLLGVKVVKKLRPERLSDLPKSQAWGKSKLCCFLSPVVLRRVEDAKLVVS
ncbi:hypothetical protein AAY473_001871, partial [Plecturocebus cupreus]